MKNWIFQILYEANGTEDPAHIIKQGGRLQQLCLHKFETRSIDAYELDITVLSFLLRLFAKMSASENSALDSVNLCRNSICHARSTNYYSMAELNTMWAKLESDLINLSDKPYQRIIQKQIQACRKHEIDKEEIAELFNRINSMEIVVDVHTHHLNNNHIEVPEYITKLANLCINGSNQVQECVSDQSRAIKQTGEAVGSLVKSEVHDLKESIAKHSEDMMAKFEDKLSALKEELLHKYNKVEFEVQYDKPVTKNSPEEMVTECLVLWHLKTPKEWNEKDVADALKDFEKLADKQAFKIKFVREGSLIILTAVPYSILHNKVNYEHAIQMFLTKMMDVCSIDTKIACHVKATLHILEKDEVSLQHAYVLCEDKSTQINIQQEDKSFQIDSRKSAEGIRSLEKRNTKHSSYNSCKSSLTDSQGLERLRKSDGSSYAEMFGVRKITKQRDELEFTRSLEEISSLPKATDTKNVRLSRKQLEKLTRDKKCSIL